MIFKRAFGYIAPILHENPLGLPQRNVKGAPQIPRRGGPIVKRRIPNVKKVVAVASGKGGVGKSTIAVNLAFAIALHPTRPRVGILDLDIFGPSIPKLMGLENVEEPWLTSNGAIVPPTNHSLPCMSMGFLLPSSPSSPSSSNEDTPVVWRGLMVQKAVQQLLFDVDWRGEEAGAGLDLLVIDMPPGTGDVPLTLGQLVVVDGAVIVSTPQSLSLSDVRKGIAMFRKVDVPITGIVLNQSHYICPSCSSPHYLFGPPDRFIEVAEQLGVRVLGQLPLVPEVSMKSDAGVPYMLAGKVEGDEWRNTMNGVASSVLDAIKLS
ncbi:P-loop containing nucleoside triphosphate hydrolase protein [Neolentinus lepideus HHB14362 ss-1]|uniref:p-loop containing nucleoside triphosphate hydrolase protein n=1 Tax=Neolentinus lepideus HHB14362 ss-1 TaxID=1314782 RepID=A0A165Q502_9AGAM|nr:P-loop containing nucleoside triphosphate hydrolase protein [Neolentinus lepideus HHB14362 ss-1]